MLVSMIGGFLGAALAAALFGAGVLFERRRRPGKREAGRMEPPERAFWPLLPLPQVLPRPELSPLPRRFLRCLAPGLGLIV